VWAAVGGCAAGIEVAFRVGEALGVGVAVAVAVGVGVEVRVDFAVDVGVGAGELAGVGAWAVRCGTARREAGCEVGAGSWTGILAVGSVKAARSAGRCEGCLSAAGWLMPSTRTAHPAAAPAAATVPTSPPNAM
jgi:hypothetical protein